MARKRLMAEQIVTKLLQIEVLQAQGKTILVACNEAETTGQCSGTNAPTARSSTASRKRKWSLRNGASTTTPNVHTHRSGRAANIAHNRAKSGPSRRGRQHVIISHINLVQNIGQARRRRQVVAGKLPCHYSSVAVG